MSRRPLPSVEFVWHGVEFERGTANAISRTIKVQTLMCCRNRSWTHRGFDDL
ncbi:hypothetical protein [Rhodococcus sp. H-CA8f]|uniref:hypothetical protein n=1 Tax=Rhodococcus sp. H-CA8f TaxID=1727214 RepID=UPI0012FF7B49|nr:hypothetical protein [Rhodococcus sp. H-CA8f]